MRNPQIAKRVKQIKRIRKWKKRGLIVLFTFIFLIGFMLTLIYTSLGIKIASSVIERLMPEIRIERVSGALNDLSVEGFSLQLDGIDVKVGQAELSLSGLCLIEGRICIKNLNAKDVLVDIRTDELSSGDEQPQKEQNKKRTVISMPLPLELRTATLNNVGVNVDDMHFGLSSFRGNATWVNEKIYVFNATAMDAKAIFADSDNVKVVSKPESNSQAKADEQSINEIINEIFNKPLIASLPEVSIPLDIYVNSLKGDNWLLHMGGQDYWFNNVAIQTNVENNFINAKSVKTDAKTPYGNASTSVSGQVTLGKDWPISAEIEATTELQNNQVPTNLSATVDGKLLGTLAAQTKIQGLNNVAVDAKINFIETYMPVIAKLNGSYIQWPIIGKAQYQLKDFNLDLSGSVKNYHFNGNGNFYGEDLPTVEFDMQTKGTNEFVDIKNLTATLPQGQFDLAGNVNWLNKLKWDASINFNKIDLSREIPNYPIKLDGQVKTNGELDAKSWVANLTDVLLNGNINEAPLHASGNVSINSNQFISANQFNIVWGNNNIYLNGSTKQENLIADLNLTELKLIDKQLNGQIKGKLAIEGSASNPVLKTNLAINHFEWQEIFLESGLLTGKVEYNNLFQGDLNLSISNFEMTSVSIDKGNITFSGDELNHQLTLSINGRPASVKMSLEGHLSKDRSQWSGALSDAIIILSQNNHWQINDPVALTYNLNNQQASIAAHCWFNNQSKICLDNNVVIANKGEASVSLKDIDLGLFDVLNESETKLAGLVHGKAIIKWDPSYTIPSITANIKSNDVYVKQIIASQTLPIPFDLFTINANINDKQALLDWNFSLKEFGKFTGNVQIDDPTDKKQLKGRVIIDKLSLSIINPLLDNNDYADGIINGDLTLSGSLLDPYIWGDLDLEHSEIKSTQLPADIQSIMVDIDFKGKSSMLKGKMHTSDGDVNIDGKADWQNIDNWNAYVTVKGAAIAVTLPPMITMSIVPDIRIEANQDELNLTGKVRIPQGNIKVESLPPTIVDVSPDEVMLDVNLEEIEPQNFGMRINTRLLVSLGNNVNIDAFGLSARLRGDLFINQSNSGLSVNGQITVASGRFRAYGQDLIVRTGEILFAGPADQPRLNIEAIRNPDSIEDNVVAGIRVTGLADEPRVEVFSDPAMSQQEALSYLLRGQGLSSGEQSDNDMMTALLIGLGTAQGGQFVGGIGDIFGIKNLTLDTQGVGDGQKVVVSGYILPHLQLKYGVGIFDSLASFTLRYRLLPRLYLEATSSLDQTVDLIYQFEF